jgi:hypothetical protein
VSTSGIQSSDGSVHITGGGDTVDLKVTGGGGGGVQLGGDIGGTNSTPLVIGLQGVPISSTPATAGQVYVLTGGSWVATSIPLGINPGTGIGVSSSAGIFTISNTGVTSFNTRTGAVSLSAADVEGTFGAKGQLFVGTGSGSGTLLGVGTDTYVLTADSTQASGIKWAASSGGVTSFNTRTGAVTLQASDVEGLFTAKGQLFAGTGSGTGELFGLGSAGQYLEVGGTDASGLVWASQAALANAAAPSRVQGTTVNVAATGGTLTPALTGITQGNVLILTVVDTSQTTGTLGVSSVSGAGATWARATGVDSLIGSVEIWYGLNTTGSGGSQTVTVTLAGSDTAGCQLDEWTNVENVAGIVDSRHPPFTNNASSTSPSITPTVGRLNELLYVASLTANTETASPGAPYSTLTGPTTGGNQKAGIAYWVANTLTSAAATWTQSTGNWVTISATLKPIEVPTFQQTDVTDEQMFAQALAGSGAVIDGCAVGPNTGSDFKFQVAAGTLQNGNTSIAVSALTAQTITAADTVNPRRDLVYVVSGTGTVKYIAGTPAINPATPYLPNDCASLCVIDIPANATTVTTANFFDKRVVMRLPNAGWTADTNTWTFNSATASTASSQVSINNDATQYLQLGDRIQLTNNGITQYFIVTQIGPYQPSNGTTGVILYGGNVPVFVNKPGGGAYTHAGGALTSIGVTALQFPVLNGSTLTFNNGDTATVSAAAAVGATSISITSTTPSTTNGGWNTGQGVACTNYLLANSAITAVSYSHTKTPYGFYANPQLWTQIYSDNLNLAQSSPIAGTLYNLNGASVTVPIGAWRLAWTGQLYYTGGAANSGAINLLGALTTSNSSISDDELVAYTYSVLTEPAGGSLQLTYYKDKNVLTTSATTYYLLIEVSWGLTQPAAIGFYGPQTQTVLRAISTYV